jgi:hypothetical protein
VAPPTVPTAAHFKTPSALSVSAILSGVEWAVPFGGQANPQRYDTVVAIVTGPNDMTALTAPSGWTSCFTFAAGDSSAQFGSRGGVWKRTISASDVGSTTPHTWTMTRTAASWLSVRLLAFRGANSSFLAERRFLGPFEYDVTVNNTVTNTVTSNAMTYDTTDPLFIFHAIPNQGGAGQGLVVDTAPAGMTALGFYTSNNYITWAEYFASLTGGTQGVTSFGAKSVTFKRADNSAYTGRSIGLLFQATPNALPTVTVTDPPDPVFAGTTSTISATASDAFGSIDTSVWSQVSGPAVSLAASPGSFNVNVTAGAPGTVVLRLTVTDNDGGTSRDDTTLTVTGSAPTVYAGADRTAGTAASVTISDASAFTSVPGATLTYAWTQLSGTAISNLVNANTLTPTFTNPASASTVVMRLTVTDSNGLSAHDDVSLTVVSTATPVPTPLVGSLTVRNDTVAVKVIPRVVAAPGADQEHLVTKAALTSGVSTVWTRGGLVQTASHTVERSLDNGTTWKPVRFASGVALGSGGLTVVADYELPSLAAALYRARTSSDAPTTLTSPWSLSPTVTLDWPGWWLKNPLDPTKNVELTAGRQARVRSKDRVIGRGFPFGRRNPVTTFGDIHGSVVELPVVHFFSAGAWDRFEAIWETGSPLLLQNDVGEQWYVTVDGFQEALTPSTDMKSAPWRSVGLKFVESDAP